MDYRTKQYRLYNISLRFRDKKDYDRLLSYTYGAFAAHPIIIRDKLIHYLANVNHK